MTTIDKTLLDILVCPVSKKTLSYDESTNELICSSVGLECLATNQEVGSSNLSGRAINVGT